MAEIIARLDEAQIRQQEMVSKQKSILEKLDELHRIVNSTKDAWNSTSNDTFISHYTPINNVLQHMANTVGEGAVKFQQIIDGYSDTEMKSSSLLESAEADMAAMPAYK